ncbi:hypothetical protein K1719_042914 [Acacia pycnantha]|nr:hypothetical protein K1719_042914 [Acacia pycnantha]
MATFLIDLSQSGLAFTWSNNRSGSNLVLMERLDRAFCNISWMQSFPLSFPVASDHCPILSSSKVSKWSKMHVGNLSHRIQAAEHHLQLLSSSLDSSGTPLHFMVTEFHQAKHQLEFLYDCEASFWA